MSASTYQLNEMKDQADRYFHFWQDEKAKAEKYRQALVKLDEIMCGSGIAARIVDAECGKIVREALK